MITAAAILLLALSSGPAVSCNEKTQGQMWPAEATVSRTAMRRSVECGQLYVCERGNWRRQWRQVSVPYWQLAGRPRPVECGVSLGQ